MEEKNNHFCVQKESTKKHLSKKIRRLRRHIVQFFRPTPGGGSRAFGQSVTFKKPVSHPPGGGVGQALSKTMVGITMLTEWATPEKTDLSIF